jgi:hypothetical protein
VDDATLAQRAYAVLERALEEAGELEPGHGRKAADRAIAARFGVSEASARNWRRGRQQHVSARIGERLVGEVAELSTRHAERLRMLHDLAHRLDRIDRIAERLAAELAAHMGDGTTWHIYSGPLVLAFAPSLRPAERADLAERAAALIVRASELGFDHRDVPALPELLRALLHLWHHAGTFGLRARSVQRVLARAGQGYLNRIELALYLGDVCTMPGLFTGDLAEAERNARRASALLDEASDADEAASPVSRRDAATMLASVRAQILACHAPVAARPELAAFAERSRSEAPEIGWIDSVRCGALGYLAAMHGDAPEAAERFEAAVERSQAWLREIGIPFATTPHRALAACARRRAGGSARACLAQAHQALLEATELAARVDEVAARRAAEALERDLGDGLRADHHAHRAAQRVEQHGLQAWDRVLVDVLTVTAPRAAGRLGPATAGRA